MFSMFLHAIEFILRVVVNTISIVDLVIYHTLIVTRNASKLYSFLIRGTKTWIVMFGRLMMFTFILGIGWYRLLKYWIFSPLILRNVEYGQGGKFRNLMDIYLPVPHNPHTNNNKRNKGQNTNEEKAQSVPVVIFVSGGAWIIGYKLWSALVARGLSHLGLVCIVPDYRNFPQGDVEDMMADIRAAIEWTTYNASRFGGDSNKIVLAGQSAGAHICTCLLVDDFLRAHNNHKYHTTTPSTTEFAPSGTVMGVESCVVPVLLSPKSLSVDDNLPSPTSKDDDGEMSAPPSSESLEGLNFSSKDILDHSADDADADDSIDINGDGDADGVSARESKPPLHKHVVPASSTASLLGHAEDGLHIRIPVSLNSGYVLADDVTTSQSTVNAVHTSTSTDTPSEHHFNASEHIRLFIGVSGPYNLDALVSHLQHRGLDPSILQYICKGDVVKYSPTIQLLEYCALKARQVVTAQQQQQQQSAGPAEGSDVDEQVDEDGVYLSESNRASPISQSSKVRRQKITPSTPLPANKTGKAAPRLLPLGRPFYAYYLPQVHSFFALGDEDGPDGGLVIANTTNTPLPSEANLRGVPVVVAQEVVDEVRVAPVSRKSSHLSAFPPVALFHGSKDKSIPMSNCSDLFDALRANGAPVDMKIYNHWSHTDAIVEAPLSGNMRLFYDMVDYVEMYTKQQRGGGSSTDSSDNSDCDTPRDPREVQANCSSQPTQHGQPVKEVPTRARRDSDWYHEDGRSGKDDTSRQKLDVMVPRVLVNMARKVNPF